MPKERAVERGGSHADYFAAVLCRNGKDVWRAFIKAKGILCNRKVKILAQLILLNPLNIEFFLRFWELGVRNIVLVHIAYVVAA